MSDRLDPKASSSAAAPVTAPPPESSAGEPTLAAVGAGYTGAARAALGHPERVGRYRIDSVLGEGGMGVVYKAEQTHPVRRIVALKLIKLGLDTRQVVARFDAERQALAMLDHPNVARVFDAGADDLGRPYFVMEHVAGVPLTQYCDARRLPTAQRLSLFTQACAAILHAHQKGIIHRDLKPGNLLVADVDGQPAVKVIDFGLAKAMSEPLSERALATERGQLLGTPEYMSPEQASGGSAIVDTRADVYALGVILYELVTGVLPFDPESLRSGSIADIERTIRHTEPPRPSARLTRDVSLMTLAAHARSTDRQSLVRTLRSDLDWVVMRAIEKEPERRYASVSELAADVGRYLRHEPVLAGPPSVAYRVRKFVRRNRVGVGVTLVLLASLVGGLVMTTHQMLRARRAEAEANARFGDVRELASRFMFDFHRQIAHLPGSTPAVRMLVETSLDYLNRLAPRAADDPTLLAEIAKAYELVGDIQGSPHGSNLGDTAGALESYRRAAQLRDELLRKRPGDVQAQRDAAVNVEKVAQVLQARGESDEALRQFQAALERRRALAARSPDNDRLRRDVLTSHMSVGDGLRDRGRFEESLAHFDEVRRAAREMLGAEPDNPEARYRLASSLNRGGDVLEKLGRIDEALARYREALGHSSALAEAEPNNTKLMRSLALAYGKVSGLLSRTGEHAEALDLLGRAVELDRRRAAADPDDMLAARDYAARLYGLGEATLRTDAAAGLERFREAQRITEQIAAKDTGSAAAQSDLASVHDAVGKALASLGRRDEADDAYARGLEAWRKLYAADPANVENLQYLAESLLNLGDLRAAMGQDARPLYSEAGAALGRAAERGALPPDLQKLRDQVAQRLQK
jgi:serine/threonine-protein kinase